MQSFCAVLDCSNRANREKAKSNYRFPSIVKNSGKEDLELSKVRREKWLAKILRKDLTERKLERTRMLFAFCLPFIGFFTQSSQY